MGGGGGNLTIHRAVTYSKTVGAGEGGVLHVAEVDCESRRFRVLPVACLAC